MKAVKKDVFDINKVTVVGSPTITSDGVASGFSGGNYVKTQNILTFGTSFEIYFGFKKVTSASLQDVFTINNVQGISTTITTNSKLTFMLGDGTQWVSPTITGTTTLIKNTEYLAKLTYKNNEYALYISSDNGMTWNKEGSYNSNTQFLPTGYPINIGASRGGVANFTGSIDLNSFKIYIDNQLVYSPTKPTYLLEKRKEGFDLSKFTVVGSPIITDNGVASGFSDSNYLRGATGITLGDNFKIRVKFTTGDDVTSYQGILRMQSTTGFLCSISNRTNSPRLVLGIPDKSDISVIPVMKTNTEYKILIECQNGLLTTYYSENNSNLTKVSEVENVNITLTNTFLALGNNTNLYFWQGSINLPSFSITVDGKEVFTGAKEKFYAIGD